MCDNHPEVSGTGPAGSTSPPHRPRSTAWLVLGIGLLSVLVGFCGGGTSMWLVQKAQPTATLDLVTTLRMAERLAKVMVSSTATAQASDCEQARQFLEVIELTMQQEAPITAEWNEAMDERDVDAARDSIQLVQRKLIDFEAKAASMPAPPPCRPTRDKYLASLRLALRYLDCLVTGDREAEDSAFEEYRRLTREVRDEIADLNARCPR